VNARRFEGVVEFAQAVTGGGPLPADAGSEHHGLAASLVDLSEQQRELARAFAGPSKAASGEPDGADERSEDGATTPPSGVTQRADPLMRAATEMEEPDDPDL